MQVQAFCSEAAIKCLDECVGRGFSRAREVEDHSFGVGRKVEIARHKFRPLINTDRLGIADLGAHSLERPHHLFAAVAMTWIKRGLGAREGVGHRQNPQLLSGSALVVNVAHGPEIIRFDRYFPILPQFGFDPALLRLVA